MLCFDAADSATARAIRKEMQALVDTWQQKEGCPMRWGKDIADWSDLEQSWLRGFVVAVHALLLKRRRYVTFYTTGWLEMRLGLGQPRVAVCFPNSISCRSREYNLVPNAEGNIVGFTD